MARPHALEPISDVRVTTQRDAQHPGEPPQGQPAGRVDAVHTIHRRHRGRRHAWTAQSAPGTPLGPIVSS